MTVTLIRKVFPRSGAAAQATNADRPAAGTEQLQKTSRLARARALFHLQNAPSPKKPAPLAQPDNAGLPAKKMNAFRTSDVPAMRAIDTAAGKDLLQKKLNADRARALFHFQKAASPKKPDPLADMARYKRRIGKLFTTVEGHATWKQRSSSAGKIQRYLQKAEQKLELASLSGSDAQELIEELGGLQERTRQASWNAQAFAVQHAQQLHQMFGPHAVATDTNLQQTMQTIGHLNAVWQKIERLLERPRLIGAMKQLKQHFATLLTENWSPSYLEANYDTAMLPLLVAAENKRSPDLNLTLLAPHENLGDWLKNWQEQPDSSSARVMFELPDLTYSHYVTADIKRDEDGNVSVLVADPVGYNAPTKAAYVNVLPRFEAQLNNAAVKGKVALTAMFIDTQKSEKGCHIFALSSASKFADDTKFFDALHEQNLAGKQFMTAKGQIAPTLAGKGNVKFIDGSNVMPVSFVKHSQSKTMLDRWLAHNPPASAQASVNKAGQTLMERYASHQTQRYQRATPTMPGKALRVGTSLEAKRLTYMDRAMDYLSNASTAEAEAFWVHFTHTMQRSGGMPDPEKLRLETLTVGPVPAHLNIGTTHAAANAPAPKG